MKNHPLDLSTMTDLEGVETAAWRDMVAAAPENYRLQMGLEEAVINGVALLRCAKIPFIHFNCVHNLGYDRPAEDHTIKKIASLYPGRFTIYQNPLCQPQDLPRKLEAMGLKAQGGWDRIVRGKEDLPLPAVSGVEEIDEKTSGEWSSFLDRIYGLPTGPWLCALVGRPGWHHFALREEGAIVAVRTLYLGPDGGAWLGIDAPVPSLMTNRYDRDEALCTHIVHFGLQRGARLFVTDIERVDPGRQSVPYASFGRMGFRWAYLRQHYC